ncbi:MAG: hypothetical protein Tsb0013_10620 [Phycisphaerales bacterium]
MKTIHRTLLILALLLIAGVSVALGWRFVAADARLNAYKREFEQLSAEHDALREQYNNAVRETAITELHVNKGVLCVRVRTVEGVQRTIDTPFDPTGEVYIDYVIRDGRVWIRRIFDAKTPPAQAMVIDPDFTDVDWDDERSRVGKAVYRSLSEGRWVVTVTGDGSLGLAKASDAAGRADLVRAPEVRDYDEIEARVDREVQQLTAGDIWRSLLGLD